jgi:predicted acetyltransferase
MSHEYEYRTFDAGLSGDEPDAATAGWLEAESLGFLARRPTDAHRKATAGQLVTDRQRLTGVYPIEAPPHGLRAEVPVATFASFERSITVSPGRQLPAHLISSVTVRPTHRRRGILRRMMTDDLRRAAADGYALAALTASEATIYRRFGFGTASWVQGIEVTTDSRFRLISSPSGRCELLDARDLVHIAPAVFAAFHDRQPGSIDRNSQYGDRISGIMTYEGEEDRARRAAVHYDDAGVIDGYVSYGLRASSEPSTLEVNDLVAATPDAYLALWQLLASVDLSTRVSFSSGRADDPLLWALADPRLVRVTAIDDRIWLRVLDPVAAFEGRRYGASGSITFKVSDELGYAAGSFRLTTRNGEGRLERLDDSSAVELAMEAWVLGALYLGGADPRVLRDAGALLEFSAGSALELQRLLASESPVYANTFF